MWIDMAHAKVKSYEIEMVKILFRTPQHLNIQFTLSFLLGLAFLKGGGISYFQWTFEELDNTHKLKNDKNMGEDT